MILKDFNISQSANIVEVVDNFQAYINQQARYGVKNYWIEATSSVGSKIDLNGIVNIASAFISNDYLGLSQHPATKKAGIEAIEKYGTGACAAQAIGGYLDIHSELESKIASFTKKSYLCKWNCISGCENERSQIACVASCDA